MQMSENIYDIVGYMIMLVNVITLTYNYFCPQAKFKVYFKTYYSTT